jgi:hypothetical protein
MYFCDKEESIEFVDHSDFYYENDIKSGVIDLPPPEVTEIRHNAVVLQWDHGTERGRHSVHFYRIEASVGGIGNYCSDNWEAVETVHVQAESGWFQAETRIEDLSPTSLYCLRLVAVGYQGISRVSLPSTVQTLPAPTNDWWLTYPREGIAKIIGVTNGNTSFCDPPTNPTPRRGHSISSVNGRVYMFGGLTNQCVCTRNDKHEQNSICKEGAVYSNEVWMLNTFTNIWKLLLGHSMDSSNMHVPTGREQHSATVLPNGKIIIIGGRNAETVFGDVYALDVGRMTRHSIVHSQQGSVPLPLEDGGILYQPLHVNIVREEPRRKDRTLCIADLVVTIEFYHPCFEQINSISLYGPASTPSSQPSTQTGIKATVRTKM